jgi:hypothetical protein
MTSPKPPRHTASLTLGAAAGFRGDVVTTLRGRNQGAAVDINSQFRRGEKYERDVRVVDLFESHRTAAGRRAGPRVRPAIDVKIEFD